MDFNFTAKGLCLVAKNFFEDDDFMNELIQDFERVDAMAKAEEGDPLEILYTEYKELFDDIDKMVSASALEIKKRKTREKTGFWSSMEAALRTAESFKENWGFSESALGL